MIFKQKENIDIFLKYRGNTLSSFPKHHIFTSIYDRGVLFHFCRITNIEIQFYWFNTELNAIVCKKIYDI